MIRTDVSPAVATPRGGGQSEGSTESSTGERVSPSEPSRVPCFYSCLEPLSLELADPAGGGLSSDADR
jgi:hypothetical protein